MQCLHSGSVNLIDSWLSHCRRSPIKRVHLLTELIHDGFDIGHEICLAKLNLNLQLLIEASVGHVFPLGDIQAQQVIAKTFNLKLESSDFGVCLV